MNLLATGSGRLFLNATSGSNIFFDKETNAGENIDCGNIFKWSHLQKVDVSGKIVGNQQLTSSSGLTSKRLAIATTKVTKKDEWLK
ncbi:LOW QUALITY PROTEIN: hypothetical protein YC2023_073893 [Brassica napus]